MTITDRPQNLRNPAIDTERLRQKYMEERNKRLRADGNDQYMRSKVSSRVTSTILIRRSGRAIQNRPRHLCLHRRRLCRPHHRRAAFRSRDQRRPYHREGRRFRRHLVLEPISRRAMRYGFDGLYAAARRNRAHAVGEIRTCAGNARALPAHRQQYGLYATRCSIPRSEIKWDEAQSRWLISHQPRRQLHGAVRRHGHGSAARAQTSRHFGHRILRGHSFHTSRWDYDYTGGDPSGAPMEKLADKRVGIIGTGATSVQCVPHLARACKELYVFQRTPSSVDVRANAPIDPNWFSGIASPGWQQRWLENFTANQAGGNAEEDLVQDGWTDLSRRIRARILQLPREQRTVPNMRAAFEDSDFEKMEEIRTGSTPSSAIARPPASSRPGMASSASGRASTIPICRRSTRRARI